VKRVSLISLCSDFFDYVINICCICRGAAETGVGIHHCLVDRGVQDEAAKSAAAKPAVVAAGFRRIVAAVADCFGLGWCAHCHHFRPPSARLSNVRLNPDKFKLK